MVSAKRSKGFLGCFASGSPRHKMGGFTIVEVMIALAISGAILAAGLSVFGGKNNETQFNQAVYDLQSQFNSYASQVSSKFIPGYQQYSCAINSSSHRPVLTSIPSGSEATGENCIYMGQAVQVVENGDTIYNYPVFGLRTIQSGTDAGKPITTVAEGNPEPAIDGSGNLLLVGTYALEGGAIITKAQTAGGSSSNLLTFYSSLQNDNTSGNEIAATAYDYSFTSQDIARLKSCIESDAACATSKDLTTTTWQICLKSGDKKARLDIKSTATGVISKVVMDGECS